MRTGKKMVASFPSQSSVYWFDPEPVKGAEIRKIRPCVIVSPDEMNKHLQTVVVVPATSTIQPWPFRTTATILGQKSSLACDQIRVVDKQRLRAKIDDLGRADREALFGLLSSIFSTKNF